MRNVTALPPANGQQPWRCAVCGAVLAYSQPIAAKLEMSLVRLYQNWHEKHCKPAGGLQGEGWQVSELTKGVFGGLCNRSSCQRPGADWFNHSTRAYYCRVCARLINDINRADAQRLYGHELCTQGAPNPITIIEP